MMSNQGVWSREPEGKGNKQGYGQSRLLKVLLKPQEG